MTAPCIIRRTTLKHNTPPVADYVETTVPRTRYTSDPARARVYKYRGDAEYLIHNKLRFSASRSQWFEPVSIGER